MKELFKSHQFCYGLAEMLAGFLAFLLAIVTCIFSYFICHNPTFLVGGVFLGGFSVICIITSIVLVCIGLSDVLHSIANTLQ